jgi:L-lactate dehydrogenase
MSKLSIIGAGAVGSSIAYAAMIRSSATETVIYDLGND